MVILFFALMFLAAVMFLLKVFLHYKVIQDNDRELRKVDFGDFFYSRPFSKKRITVSLQLYSLRLIKNKQLIDVAGDIEKINNYIKLILFFVALAALILIIDLLSGLVN